MTLDEPVWREDRDERGRVDCYEADWRGLRLVVHLNTRTPEQWGACAHGRRTRRPGGTRRVDLSRHESRWVSGPEEGWRVAVELARELLARGSERR